MKKLSTFSSISFVTFFLLLVCNLFAQTPQYYNQTTGTSNNSFPFNVAGGKEVQWLFLPNEFTQPTPVPSGNAITKIYFYASLTNGGPSTFSNLLVKMGKTALTSLPSGVIYTGSMDTVFFRSSFTLSSSVNTWFSITLDNPWPYDTAQSVVLDVSQCGFTGNGGIIILQMNFSGNRRCYINGTTSCIFTFGGQDASDVDFGIDVTPTSGIEKNKNSVPVSYKLEQNYPNPFNPSTTIRYSIPKAGDVEITVHDVLGKEIILLENGYKQPGSFSVDFNATDLSSGMYFYTIKSGNFTETKKMTLIK